MGIYDEVQKQTAYDYELPDNINSYNISNTNQTRRIGNNRNTTFHPFSGLWSGIGELVSNPGNYYVQSNWRGNGLANTSLGYMADKNYRDPFSAGQAMGSLWNMRGNDGNSYQLQNILGRLSGIRGRLGEYAHNGWERIIDNRFGNRGDVYVPIDSNILDTDRIA